MLIPKPISFQYQEKCGSFREGRLHWKLNSPLIPSRTLLIVVFADSIGLVRAVLMLFQTVVAFVLILVNAVDTVVFTFSTAVEIPDLMLVRLYQ